MPIMLFVEGGDHKDVTPSFLQKLTVRGKTMFLRHPQRVRRDLQCPGIGIAQRYDTESIFHPVHQLSVGMKPSAPAAQDPDRQNFFAFAHSFWLSFSFLIFRTAFGVIPIYLLNIG